MPEYTYPPMDKRRVMGKPIARLDGIAKASGKAKYNSDVRPAGTIHSALLTCPHAHARIKSIDTSAAEKSAGVAAVRVISPAGTLIQWSGCEVALVAADTEERARDAVRKIRVDYEVLPHLVREDDLAKAVARAKPSGEVVAGDPDKAFKEAEVVHSGKYGIPVITHCCLEPHGQTIQWQGDKIEYWPSTQAVTPIGGDLAKNLQLPNTAVHVHMDYIGGGFGSKFSADRWGVEGAHVSRASGGKPVKTYLDRSVELRIAGVRPSVFAEIRLAARRDGTITGWESRSWSTGGVGGGGINAALLPYVFTGVPNKRINHSAVSTNNGAQRAWRAPMHPQLSYVTCSAMEDLAARLNMDPLALFIKNASMTRFPEVYTAQLNKAAEMIDWKKRWHPRGEGKGAVRSGLGIGVGTWGGMGHPSNCRAKIHPDGSVEVELGSQDLGTGTRTIIAQVAAESLGLRIGDVNVKLGDNSYPPSNGSGGSTTVGGVSASTRKATLNALEKLFEVVAPGLGVPPDQLEAVDGKIQVKGNPAKSLTWKAACAKLGVRTIEEMGNFNPQQPGGLSAANVAGVQMAEVSVDMETGVVKIVKIVGVQDVGLLINPKLAESQMFGGIIMNTCAALFEERVMDEISGRCLNADMEFYKLSGIADIGEIQVHMDVSPEHDKRGVIGLGEPATVPGIAAIANACANAIGVRVPTLPLTPRNVLAALERRSA